MKNAGFCIISCILLSVLIPFAVVLLRPKEPPQKEITILVEDTALNKIYEMKLEDYVLGVMRREVPASYEPEALKAQAVAVRSYAVRKAGSDVHEKADVCTSYTHCMDFLSEEDAKEKWGENFSKMNEVYKKAVEDTKNQVLEYGGETANTVFFAISSGKTENAFDIWGGEVPYLVSVESPEDLNARGFESTAEVSAEEFKEKLGIDEINIDSVQRSESGTVKNICISGKNFKGSEIRTLFSLRSANFEIDAGDKVTFKVKGYGHGVGMSQNGANECAKKGMSYDEILYKYYKGTNLNTLVDLF